MDFNINVAALVVGAILTVIVGSFWYSPVGFGHVWMKLSGVKVRKITPQVQRQMMAMYFTQMILTVLMGFVLAVMFKSLGITSLIVAYAVGIFFWLGIAIPVQMGSTMWDGKPIALFLINTGNTIVSIFIMTTVLTLWQ